MKINWDKRISDQLNDVKLSDGEQKLLAMIYNTLTGNYDPSKTRRYIRQIMSSFSVVIPTTEILIHFRAKSLEEIEIIYSPLYKHLRFTYGKLTGKGSFESFIILSGFSFSDDTVEFYVTERFIPTMIRYIDKLVKPEYIKCLPLSEIFSV